MSIMFLCVEKKIKLHSTEYYTTCAIGGVFSCGLTHAAVTPLDLVKCRVQAQPTEYPSILQGFRKTWQQDGLAGFTVGWVPTLVGYGIQGACKFGFYELFKKKYSDVLASPTLAFGLASASAELIADAAFCPMEAVKVRMQTDPTFTRSFFPALSAMTKEGGIGLFYKGLVPLWARQVPYTVIKFVAFEKVVRKLRSIIGKPEAEYTKGQTLMLTFAAGYIAGVLCAIVSHPADVLVSKVNKNPEAGLANIAKDLGFAGMWAGLGARIIMIGTLTGLQWFIYDSYKLYTGLPSTGSAKSEQKAPQKE